MSSPREDNALRWATASVVIAAIAGVYAGWREFWFLTDDAYIAFRYAHNAIVGRGLVWNPEPFRAVEGYTSLLWVKVLEGVWRTTGVEPPRSSNWLALLCGYASLLGAYAVSRRVSFEASRGWERVGMLALVAIGVVANRTVLTWMSSGLETGLFNALVTWWLFVALCPPETRAASWSWTISLLVLLLTLTRPDGMLFACATGLLLADDTFRRGLSRRLLGTMPLLGILLHLIWRHQIYGEWLPNTYYAKHVAPWPESGLRYLGSFVIEYGLWLPATGVAWSLCQRETRGRWLASLRGRGYAIVAWGALLAHLAYYTLRVGGDHFEYRVYSHAIPLLFVLGARLAASIGKGTRTRLALLATFVALSLPIPWVHWHQTLHLDTREATGRMRVAIAPQFPALLRPLVGVWDDWQDWLISRFVCVRHREHAVFWRTQLAQLPSREEGLELRWEPHHPVLVEGTVGVPGWVFPNAAVIDMFGLNDYVIARSPLVRGGGHRWMAHDRLAPKAYLQCFRPNVVLHGEGRSALVPRPRPLTDDAIRACESRVWY